MLLVFSSNLRTAGTSLPAVSTLTDSFSTSTIDSSKWTILGAGPSTGIVQQNGALELSVNSNFQGGCGLISSNLYSFNSSSAFTKVLQTTDLSSTDAVFEIRDQVGGVNGAGVQWQFANGVANARTIDQYGGTAPIGTVNFSSANPWFRIRETAGTVYWETAPSTAANPPAANQWVVQYSQARQMVGTSTTVKYLMRHIELNGFAIYRFDTINTFTTAASPVRYIRDWISGSNVNAGNHWVEIQAFDQSGINQALGKTATGNNSIISGTFAMVTDGDTNTNNYLDLGTSTWTSVTVDLGSRINITSVKRWHYSGDSRTYHSTLTEVSPDGITWYTIFDSSVSGEYSETSSGRSDPVPVYTYVPDTTAPTVTNATITDVGGKNKLRLTFSEKLANVLPAIAQFTVSGNSIAGINFLDGNYTDIVLTVSTNFAVGETVTVSYTVPATNPITDVVGNPLAAFTNRAVTNSITAVPTTRIRYVRDYIDGCYDGSYMEYGDFSEIQVLDKDGVNLATGKKVTSSWTTDQAAMDKWIDGDTNSNFYPGTDGKSMTLDLGDVYDVARIKTWHFPAQTGRYYYQTLFISADGITWTAIYDTETNGAMYESSAGQEFIAPFPPFNVQYYWQYIGGENASSAVADNTLVRYGVRPNYSYATKSGSVTLDNATFGDPAFGVAKHGDQRIANPAYVEPVRILPTVTSAVISSSVGETKIRILFSQAMANINPFAQLAVSGHTITTAAFVDLSRTYLDITVTPAFVSTDVVTLSYTAPTTNGYQNTNGAAVATFTNLAVSNTLSAAGANSATVILRTRSVPWTRMPPITQPINPVWRKRFSRVLLLNNGRGYEMYAKAYQPYVGNYGGSPVIRNNPFGAGWGVPGGFETNGIVTGSGDYNNQFHVAVVYVRNATVVNTSGISRRGANSIDNAMNIAWVNTDGVTGRFRFWSSSNFGGVAIYSGPIKPGLHVVVGNHQNNGTDRLWVDGKLVATGAGASYCSNDINFGMFDSPTFADVGDIMYIAANSGFMMADSDIITLSRNPFQIFQPRVQHMLIPANASAISAYAAHMPFFVF